MDFLQIPRWSPYLAGGAIGILSWLTFLFSDKPIGCSTSFAVTFGLLEKRLRGGRVPEKGYYKKAPPRIDWQWMFVLGIFLGSFLSSRLSGSFNWKMVPAVWSASISPLPLVRFLFAFVGGIFMGLGSRWAGGCTSGHGISGTLQLSMSSWLAVVCFFSTAILTAHFLYA